MKRNSEISWLGRCNPKPYTALYVMGTCGRFVVSATLASWSSYMYTATIFERLGLATSFLVAVFPDSELQCLGRKGFPGPYILQGPIMQRPEDLWSFF